MSFERWATEADAQARLAEIARSGAGEQPRDRLSRLLAETGSIGVAYPALLSAAIEVGRKLRKLGAQ